MHQDMTKLGELKALYDNLYAEVSKILKKAGYYDIPVVHELSAGISGNLSIDKQYLPFLEHVAKKRGYNGGYSASELLELLNSSRIFELSKGIELPLSLISIYLMAGKMREARYYFARDYQEANNTSLCEAGYFIGIGYVNKSFFTLKYKISNGSEDDTKWKISPLDTDQSSAGDFKIDKGVLKQYVGSATNIVIPDEVKRIGPDAFRDCKKIKSVTMSSNVTRIGKFAFYGCSKLTSITLPESIVQISEGAFKYCKSLKEITLPNTVELIATSLFEHCESLQKVTLPSTAIKIGEYAFADCPSLKEIAIPDMVETICLSAFRYETMLTHVHIGEHNQHYKTINGDIYSKDGKTLVLYSNGKQQPEFTVPDSVTTIGKRAFDHSIYLRAVVIPEGVEIIEEHAFDGCCSLQNVTLPRSLRVLGAAAFWECVKLEKINLDCNLLGIEEYTFCDCRSLAEVNIPQTVVSIGRGAFSSCQALESVTIPKGVTAIEPHAFSRCEKLTAVTIPTSVTTIGEDAFEDCVMCTWKE